MGQVVLGRYRLCSRIGKGTYGHVYSAKMLDPPGSKWVAIKRVQLSKRAKPYDDTIAMSDPYMFKHESYIAMQASKYGYGPHVHEVVDDGHHGYIVMDMWDGTLHELINGIGVMKGYRSSYTAIFTPIMKAHQNGCFHHDMRPCNILYRKRFNMKTGKYHYEYCLTDFSMSVYLNPHGHDKCWLPIELIFMDIIILICGRLNDNMAWSGLIPLFKARNAHQDCRKNFLKHIVPWIKGTYHFPLGDLDRTPIPVESREHIKDDNIESMADYMLSRAIRARISATGTLQDPYRTSGDNYTVRQQPILMYDTLIMYMLSNSVLQEQIFLISIDLYMQWCNIDEAAPYSKKARDELIYCIGKAYGKSAGQESNPESNPDRKHKRTDRDHHGSDKQSRRKQRKSEVPRMNIFTPMYPAMITLPKST